GPPTEIRQIERCTSAVEILPGGATKGIARAGKDRVFEEAVILILVLELGAPVADEGSDLSDDRQIRESKIVTGAPFEDLALIVATVNVAVDVGELSLQPVVRHEDEVLVVEVAGNATGEEGVLKLILDG